MKPIKTEYIKLEQYLKMNNLISTGGQAKVFLLEHKIEVNGETENRRGRKLYPGDSVAVDGKLLKVR